MANCLPAFYSMLGHHAFATGTKAWQLIRWDRVISSVKSLQSRIVKAVQAGKWRKVKALQRILSRSYAAKLLAVRRVTENSGQRTAGIDGQIWDTPQAKFEAIAHLQSRGNDNSSREETAHKVAWSAVKQKYKKGKDENWVEK